MDDSKGRDKYKYNLATINSENEKSKVLIVMRLKIVKVEERLLRQGKLILRIYVSKKFTRQGREDFVLKMKLINLKN